MMAVGIIETNVNIADRNKEKGEMLGDMGNHTKENRHKKKQREKSQFWAVKASFVAGVIVIISIFKDLFEYFKSDLPLWINCIYILGCLVLMGLVLGTEKFDKYLNSKGVENYGVFLTVCSVLVFIFENTLFKTKMDTIEMIGICLIYATFVICAVYILFSRYEK